MLENPKPRHKQTRPHLVFEIFPSSFGGGKYCWSLWQVLSPDCRAIVAGRHGFDSTAQAKADIAKLRAMLKGAVVEISRRAKR